MENLERALKELGKELSQESFAKFERYMMAVLEWNEKVNLTAITDRSEFVQKHFVDSILCVGLPEIENAKKIIDIGTGAGFPGVPLAIVYPEKEFVLLDSLAKRLKIVEQICTKLGINNVTVLHGRAEDLARQKEHREKYDLCVSRAVANLATLCEYCLPFVKKDGYFLAYKGRVAEEEVAEGQKAMNILGGKQKETYIPKISSFDFEHKLISIEKSKETPSKYPRKAGTPSKEPIR